MSLMVVPSLDDIYEVLQQYLKETLNGVILCGSYSQGGDVKRSDLDILVVVDNLNITTARELAAARIELESLVGIPCSTTAITRHDVDQLRTRFGVLDGKAVQCLIECSDDAIRCGLRPLAIPKLSTDMIKQFSYDNYWVVRSLLIKTIIRANRPLKSSENEKIAKLSLILVKMSKQYSGREHRSLKENLLAIKDGDNNFSDQEVYKLALASAGLLAKKSIH